MALVIYAVLNIAIVTTVMHCTTNVTLYTAIGQILSSQCLYRQLIEEENALLLKIYLSRHEVLTREYKVTYNERITYASMLKNLFFSILIKIVEL
jgi:hypothetical protein